MPLPSTKELRGQHDYDIRSLFDGPKTTWTVDEISKALGLGKMWVERSCQRLAAEGVLEDTKTGRQKKARWTLREEN